MAGRGEREAMDLEEVLAKVVELGREELHIVRKRAEEKTAARDHGRDYEEMLRAADQLDHHAHQLRRLHDGEFGPRWRHVSREDGPGGGP
jgi:hypothetical protein